MTDLEFGADDPLLGEVSCDDENHARAYARSVEGRAWVKTWANGEPTEKRYLEGHEA